MGESGRKNPKGLKILIKNLDALGKTSTRIGWFEDSSYAGGRPVAAVAAGNELGIPSRSIPPRPFMRPTIAEKKNEWMEKAAQLAKRVINGKMTAFQAMDTLGGIIEGDVSQTIASITSPPLSPITLGARKYREQGKKVTGSTIGEIARKLKEGKLDISGVSTKPLVDSATMIDTLTHQTEG